MVLMVGNHPTDAAPAAVPARMALLMKVRRVITSARSGRSPRSISMSICRGSRSDALGSIAGSSLLFVSGPDHSLRLLLEVDRDARCLLWLDGDGLLHLSGVLLPGHQRVLPRGDVLDGERAVLGGDGVVRVVRHVDPREHPAVGVALDPHHAG